MFISAGMAKHECDVFLLSEGHDKSLMVNESENVDEVIRMGKTNRRSKIEGQPENRNCSC